MCPERARDNSAPHDLLVIIPAWNEEESVGGVVQSVRECVPRADVLVVSDGSRDGTAAAARKAGADVLDLKINLGVGGAMRAGFVYAVDNGYRTAVQVDADGQHNPADIPALVERIEKGADIVIGSRFAGVGKYRSRGPRRWAMKILASVLSGIARASRPIRPGPSRFFRRRTPPSTWATPSKRLSWEFAAAWPLSKSASKCTSAWPANPPIPP